MALQNVEIEQEERGEAKWIHLRFDTAGNWTDSDASKRAHGAARTWIRERGKGETTNGAVSSGAHVNETPGRTRYSFCFMFRESEDGETE